MSRLHLLAAALGLSASLSHAQDWPAWGGSDLGRNMYSPATGLPDRFEPGKPKPGGDDIDLATTKNVRWIAKLGSQSYGNPVVAGGKVYVGTNNESPRDPRHTGDRSILLCLDEKTGALLWQLVVPKLKAGKANDWEALGILGSPFVEGHRLWLVTSRAEVLCLDTEGMANGNDGPFQDEANYVVQETGLPPIAPGPKDADILWRYDMIGELGTFPHNAANCSVLVVGDILYVGTGNGTDWTHANVPFPFAPSLIALDKNTGRLLAEDDARLGARIFHGQWSSPSAGVVNGKPLVFFGGGDGWLYAFDAKPVHQGGTNLLHVAWKLDGNPPEYRSKDGQPVKYGAPDGPSEINATPVFYKNRVYVATGQDLEQSDGSGHLLCADAATGALIWENKSVHRSLSTASIDPATGLLFLNDFAGFVYCFEADTGQLLWSHDMKAQIWGSTLVADGKVYVGDADGDLRVLAAAREKKLLNEVNLGGPLYSSPIVANGVLYLGTQTHLYAIGTGQPPPRP